MVNEMELGQISEHANNTVKHSISDENSTSLYLNSETNESSQGEIFEFVVQGVLITSVSILGLLANTICLLVMSQPALKKGQCSSVNALLTSMAAVDIILLLCR